MDTGTIAALIVIGVVFTPIIFIVLVKTFGLVQTFLVIFFLIVSSGVIFILLQIDELVTGGKIAFAVIVICLFVKIAMLIFFEGLLGAKEYKLRETTIEIWNITLVSIIVLMLIVGVSMQCAPQLNGSHDPGWLIAYVVLIIFLLATFLISLTRWSDKIRDYVGYFWNPDTGLAGDDFSDFTNAVGILAGIGAYELARADEGWFWLGQFGAFLTALIGLSLTYHWIIELRQSEKNTQWWNAFGNLLCGTFTFLAIITAAIDLVTGNSLIWILQVIILSILIISSILIIKRSAEWMWGLVLVLPLVLLLITPFLLYLINPEILQLEWMSPSLAIAATLITVLMEFCGFWETRKPLWTGRAFKEYQDKGSSKAVFRIEDWKIPLKVVRSLDIILGNLALFALVLWTMINPPLEGVLIYDNPAQWFLLCGAIILMTQASLGGIIMAAHEKVKRSAEEKEYKLAYQNVAKEAAKRGEEWTAREAGRKEIKRRSEELAATLAAQKARKEVRDSYTGL